MTNRKIGVVTVTHNSVDSLGPFLTSVTRASVTKPEIVVVDNASDDLQLVRNAASAGGARFIDAGANLGYGSAMNLGARAIPPEIDILLLSNPDVEMSPGSIDALVDALVGDNRIASVGPRIRNADGTVYPSARQVPSLTTGVGHALFSNTWKTNPWSRRYRNEVALGDAPQDVGWLSGACVAVRRSAFEAVNGFDESFFMYFEDVDLGYRFGARGWRNVYVPSAEVIHTGAHSTGNSSERMAKQHHISATRFISKRYPQWYFAPVRALARLGLSVRSWWTTVRSR